MGWSLVEGVFWFLAEVYLEIVVETGAGWESLVGLVGYEVCAGVLVKVCGHVPYMWAGEMV